MPYRAKDIYRGRRKFRVPLTIALFVLAFLIIGTVAMFYILQQFLVYDQTGVSLQLPFMRSGTADTEVIAEDTPAPTFEPVDVTVVYEDPEFTDVDLGGWEDLAPTKARYITFSEATNASKLASAVSQAETSVYTGLVLELKNRDGSLAWASQSEMAMGYGTNGSMDYTDTVAELHEHGLTAAAQISCCADKLLATRNWPVALQTSGGKSYQDGNGVYWLDPYNRTVRAYIIELMGELAAMGFDEIILADLYHPVTDSELTYSVNIQTAPDPVIAVCQMGRRLVESMEDTGVAVSVLIDRNSAETVAWSQTGQDLDIFWRLFARIYCPTDSWNVTADRDIVCDRMTEGDIDVRFVPVLDVMPEGFQSYVFNNIYFF